MKRLPVGLALAALCSSCGEPEPLPPAGQTLLYLTTDAPLPPPPGTSLDPNQPLPLFDRVRIDVFEPGSPVPCNGCSRELELDRDRVARGASIGVAQRPGAAGYSARVRLFRAAAVAQGEPIPSGTVDVTVALPAVREEGIEKVTVVLPTGAVGKPRGSLAVPEQPDPGEPPANMVGTWPGATRAACTRAPDATEVCVPGGAYWMGSAVHNYVTDSYGGSDELRLVVLSPFLLSKSEVTVAQMREWTGDAQISGLGGWTGGDTGSSVADFCTFHTSGAHDGYPVNCVTWNLAQQFCAARGGTLPTEAQHEFVASGLRSSAYVWGDDEPSCSDAVHSRGGVGVLKELDAPCRKPSEFGGALPIGSGARDRLKGLAGGEVVDLAGNLAEWALDRWANQSDACWTEGVVQDPLCPPLADANAWRSVRGGSFSQEPAAMRAATKQVRPGNADVNIGFRCARPGK